MEVPVGEEYGGGWLGLLPENCLCEIILKTSIKDACRSSVVSRGLKSASESDYIWDQFLPCDYQDIISRSDDDIQTSYFNFSTKKQLFFMLCDSPLLIDHRTLSFWLCKTSGKKCFMVGARELSIAWKDTPRYWLWKPFPESRFSEVAELLSVCWLHIQGKIQAKFLSPKTTYAAYIVYKLDDNSYGLETASMSCVKFTGDQDTTSAGEFEIVHLMPVAYTDRPIHRRQRRGFLNLLREVADSRLPHERMDGWMEICLGEFYNDDGVGEIEMQLSETIKRDWKKGLILEGIEVRPKED